MSPFELFSRLTNEWPAAEPVVPVVFLDDDLLPIALAPVEPVAFFLACSQATWVPDGHDN
jgi:hypothetical protein